MPRSREDPPFEEFGRTIGPVTGWLRRGGVLAVLYGAIWWIVSNGAASSWVVGVPAVVLAVAATLRLTPPPRVAVSPRALAAFLPYFLWRSLAGGIDVAVRALRPSLPVAPTLRDYALRLPEHGPARVFFVNVLSLLPGTLAAELMAGVVRVHWLSEPDPASLEQLERHAARLFGHQLAEGHRASGDAHA
jgi:multicomponent Na+:H+ antiporter subunit E